MASLFVSPLAVINFRGGRARTFGSFTKHRIGISRGTERNDLAMKPKQSPEISITMPLKTRIVSRNILQKCFFKGTGHEEHIRCGGNGGGPTKRYWWCDGSKDEGPKLPPRLDSMIVVAMARRRLPEFDPWRGKSRSRIADIQGLLRGIRISYILLALNVGIFVIQTLYGPGILMSGAKVNSAIAAGEYYRLLSPMFLHASITHLMVNSFSLHSTGPSVESWFGKGRFLSLYITSGVMGNLLSFLCSPTPAVGASGAIFGLVGASVVLLGRHRRMLPRSRQGLQSLAYIVLMNFGMGMTPGSRIDNFGHLGGFLGGIAFSYLLGPRLVMRRGRSGRPSLRDEPILSVAVDEFKARLKSFRNVLKGR